MLQYNICIFPSPMNNVGTFFVQKLVITANITLQIFLRMGKLYAIQRCLWCSSTGSTGSTPKELILKYSSEPNSRNYMSQVNFYDISLATRIIFIRSALCYSAKFLAAYLTPDRKLLELFRELLNRIHLQSIIVLQEDNSGLLSLFWCWAL